VNRNRETVQHLV